MLQNDPHNATKTTESLNWFVLDFCWVGHSFSSSEVHLKSSSHCHLILNQVKWSATSHTCARSRTQRLPFGDMLRLVAFVHCALHRAAQSPGPIPRPNLLIHPSDGHSVQVYPNTTWILATWASTASFWQETWSHELRLACIHQLASHTKNLYLNAILTSRGCAWGSPATINFLSLEFSIAFVSRLLDALLPYPWHTALADPTVSIPPQHWPFFPLIHSWILASPIRNCSA